MKICFIFLNACDAVMSKHDIGWAVIVDSCNRFKVN